MSEAPSPEYQNTLVPSKKGGENMCIFKEISMHSHQIFRHTKSLFASGT